VRIYNAFGVVALAASLLWASYPQSFDPEPERGHVEHNGSTTKIISDDSRPLLRAIDLLRQPYGWKIDYVDPPYENEHDLSVVRFETSFQEISPDVAPLAEQKRILESILDDYNQGSNPGKFMIEQEQKGHFAIVGIGINDSTGSFRSVPDILQTQISIPREARSAEQTMQLICDRMAVVLGMKILGSGFGGMADMVAMKAEITEGGENVTAGNLIAQTISDTNDFFLRKYSLPRLRVWRLLYDVRMREYFLSLAD
jgi:hypothetical protein